MNWMVRSVSAAAASVALPVVFTKGLLDRRFGESLFERCTGSGWDQEPWDSRPKIWVHAASVGEVAGVSPLVQALSAESSHCELLLTTTSITGREEARRRSLADRALLFPLDHPVYIRRALNMASPSLVVITETELWPSFLCELARRQIPVALVNGRISDYSFPRYRRLKWLFSPLLQGMSVIATQHEEDAERFVALGADPKRVVVAGSTKYSVPPALVGPEERQEYADLLGIDRSRSCVVAGSVRTGEDEQVIEAYLAARAEVPELQMIIAPRHPERFIRVARILERRGIAFRRRSAVNTDPRADVVLLDTIGELTKAYAIGSFAFVGGSLVDIGGHNPFEPCLYRTPVVMGPHVANVQEVVRDLSAAGALLPASGTEELASHMVRLARHGDETLLRGARGYEVWQRYSTAVERILPLLLPHIPPVPQRRAFQFNSHSSLV